MKILIAVVVMFFLYGCSGSTGWRVSFGVSPVKQISDKQELVQNK